MTSTNPHRAEFRQVYDAHMTVQSSKPVETFWLDRDPITQERFDAPQPQYRKCIPVYDRETGELREFIL